MAHLRKYTTLREPKYFDPRCVDGVDSNGGSPAKTIYIHLLSGGEPIAINVMGHTDVEAWVQTNIIDIAGENPDITECV